MKKSILLSALALVAFAGCSKTEVKPVEDAPAQISWNAVVGKASTKAMIDGTKYEPTAPSFGTFAYYLEDGTWATNKANAQLYIPQSEVKATVANAPTIWSTETFYYWPQNEGSLTFFSYSPFKYQETPDGDEIAVTIEDKDGLKIQDYDVDAHQDTDFMVALSEDKRANASNVPYTSGTYTGVPVEFKHKLSQIVGINFITINTSTTTPNDAFDYSNGHDGTTGNEYQAGDVLFKLVKVEISDILTKGDYSFLTALLTDVWTNQSATKNYTWFDQTNGVAFDDNTTYNLKYNTGISGNNEYLLVLPQTFGDPALSTTTVKTALNIEYQILTYTDATNYSTQNVSKTVYLYNMHCDTHDSDAHSYIDMNKKITYNIKIDLYKNRIYWAPSVVDWEEENYTASI